MTRGSLTRVAEPYSPLRAAEFKRPQSNGATAIRNPTNAPLARSISALILPIRPALYAPSRDRGRTAVTARRSRHEMSIR